MENAVREKPILKAEDLSLYYGEKKAIDSVNIEIFRRVTAIIGPSGCGKSTLLRSFNRMNDFISGVKVSGKAFYKDQEIYGKKVDAATIRSQIGMVFQRPNPFPKSIIQNIIWGPKINGLLKNANELVERALIQAALWEEVKDRLHDSALNLSGGQQQRLCIARAIAMNPEVILMDEPCSALDPNATARIEDLIGQLSQQYTIVIVTHNMQQAARVSKMTAFFYNGKLIEYGKTKNIFTKPKVKMTEEYITGRFG